MKKLSFEEAIKTMMELYDSVEKYMPVIFQEFIDIDETELVAPMDAETMLHFLQLWEMLSENAKRTLDQLVINRVPEMEQELRATYVNGNICRKSTNPRKLFARKRVVNYLGKTYGKKEAIRIYEEIKKYMQQI